MTADVVNLRLARKRRARTEAAEAAAEARARHGRTKAGKALDRAEAEAAVRRLEGHRLADEPAAGRAEDDPAGPPSSRPA